jgi:hypothetical protein
MRLLGVLGLSGLLFAAVTVTTNVVGWALAAAGLTGLVNRSVPAPILMPIRVTQRGTPRR